MYFSHAFVFVPFVAFVLASSFARGDSGARTVKYAETDIIAIRAKIRFSTLNRPADDEEILDATTGDKEFWIINGAHNLCYLHPAQQGILAISISLPRMDTSIPFS